MPFPTKVQPVDFCAAEGGNSYESEKPEAKWRFKRVFEKQFQSILRTSGSEKGAYNRVETGNDKNGSIDLDPSSLCLNKMVQNFIEDSDDRQRCSRNRCKCFNRNSADSSEDEEDSFTFYADSNSSSFADTCERLKTLLACVCVSERKLFVDTSRIVEKNRVGKPKNDICRRTVVEGLVALGYDASLCMSRWEKSAFCPAGEYEYVDAIMEGERLIIDIDFRAEFEIARSTKAYKSLLQYVPNIFVGKADRLQGVLSILSEAAQRSLRKKGLLIPPWRKFEYVKAKWLAPFTRRNPASSQVLKSSNSNGLGMDSADKKADPLVAEKSCGRGVKLSPEDKCCPNNTTDNMANIITLSDNFGGEEEERTSEAILHHRDKVPISKIRAKDGSGFTEGKPESFLPSGFTEGKPESF